MAYKTNELYNETTQEKLLRFVPTSRMPKTLINIAGAPTLEFGTMMGFDTTSGFWVPWDPAGATGFEIARAFLMTKIVADATDESIIDLMLAGTLHRDDVALNGESQAAVDTELTTILANGSGNFFVQGLKEVR